MQVLPILVKAGVVKAGDAAAIENEAQRDNLSIEAVLGKRNIAIADILKAVSERYGIPARTLPSGAIDHTGLEYIPEESARHYGIVPIGMAGGALEVGIRDPDDLEALGILRT